MYLKRLDINGFKSFASATSLEFGAGVTCIAGPNGSGKTNVAEAIRWVLGEQAGRVIRARKTEDIIFTGSEKRSAMGVAEVRITLDNSDSWLPVDFEEVVVARRAYRSGDNEYFLNQSRVRLKDLHELFMKAQVGQNSYAFMGQGLVEQVLTLRPEDRRGLIEEAANVRLHREKLNESRNRLNATRDNLERVELLVREIEPQLRKLERQANRAADHARLSADLAGALRTLYGQQWQDAQEALTAARAAYDQRKEEFDRAEQELKSLEEGFSSLGTAVEDRRRDINERMEASRTLDEYRRDLDRRITVDTERQAMLESRREELAGEIESLEQEQARVIEIVSAQEERARAIQESLASTRAPEADVQELARIEARLGELRTSLAESEEGVAQTTARLAEAEAKSAALAEQEQRLQSELATMQETRVQQIAALKTWAHDFATQRERWQQLAPAVGRATLTLDQTKERLEHASIAVVRRQEEIRTLNAAVESAAARLDAAQSSDIDLPEKDAGVRTLLVAGGKVPDEEPEADSRIHGLIGMVGQLIRVPSGLERAIEAALADSLHAIVVETQEDALAGIELLISGDEGRAIIYPLNDIRQSHPINLMKERGVIGVASELVRCDKRYRPLIDTLLGRTIVAQNIGTAMLLLRRGLGSVVTLDGALLHTSGAMTAGSAKAVRRAFVHQRDVGELPKELERMRASLEQAATALETEQSQQTDAQQARDRLAPELERMRSDLAGADEALRQHRARLPITAAHLSTLHARRHEARRELGQASEALAAARAAGEQANGLRERHIEARDRLRPEIEQQATARESLARAGSERSTRIAALESEQQAFRQQTEVQSASHERVSAELARKQELAARVQDDVKRVLERLAASRSELEEKSNEADAAREELAPARNALEQIESRQRTIDSDLAAGRSRTLAAERTLLEAESAMRLRSEELETLRERLEEEGFRPSEDGEVIPPAGQQDATPAAGQPPAWMTADSDADQPPAMRGGAHVDTAAVKDRIGELRADIRNLGPVNEQAATDYAESKERHEFLSTQLADLRDAEAALQEAIDELEAIMKERFSTTFRKVNQSFQRYFQTFFGGGEAELVLTRTDADPEDGQKQRLPGVDIIAQPPRKKVRTLNMLSGGERSLTALALLFALLDTNPSPICVLDEVDAALDEANVVRFTAALKELSERTQFIIITHNRRTLEMADTIYGISMGEDSTSTILSLRLADIPAK